MISLLFFYLFIYWIVLLYLRNLFFLNKKIVKFTSYNNLISNLFFPRLNVFSPNPLSSDYKIFYRDLLINKTETKLNEIAFYNQNDLFFFNKNLRNKGFLSWLINSIRLEEKNEISFKKNSIYNNFKLKISEKKKSENTKIRQIIIMRTYGFYNNKKESIELIDYIYL